MRINKDLKELFLELTEYTAPYKTETQFFPILCDFFGTLDDSKVDDVGNVFIDIGDKPSVAFMCHMDTACYEFQKVNHVIQGHLIRTDGTTILGADDKAGMALMLMMAKAGLPGRYCFFVGEESGLIGSDHSAKDAVFWYDINQAVSFDRYGTRDLIVTQCGEEGASSEYSKKVANYLKLEVSHNGLFTDSYSFVDLIPECTNVAVGYQRHHTVNEVQDIAYLSLLLERVKRVPWEKLPIKRDPKSYWPTVSHDEEDDDGYWYTRFNYGKETADTEHWKNVNNSYLKQGEKSWEPSKKLAAELEKMSDEKLYAWVEHHPKVDLPNDLMARVLEYHSITYPDTQDPPI